MRALRSSSAIIQCRRLSVLFAGYENLVQIWLPIANFRGFHIDINFLCKFIKAFNITMFCAGAEGVPPAGTGAPQARMGALGSTLTSPAAGRGADLFKTCQETGGEE